jgi:polyhydroxybutyrate depolymerase
VKKVILFCTLSISLFACNKDGGDNPPTPPEPGLESGLFDKTIMHNNVLREYLLYVPEGYTNDQPVPVVFSLHGAGGSKEAQYQLSEFNVIADRENFIVVTPEATAQFGSFTFWNQLNSSDRANDIGFIDTLISLVAEQYAVDLDRVYLAGSSNGAFMSFQVACELGNRIAAIAAVMGYMLPEQITNCTPTTPMAIIQMHGTKDPLVAYSGVQATIDYWIDVNQTDTVAISTGLPDIDPANGNTVNSKLYRNGMNGIEVEHLEVVNGLHDWFGEAGTNYDIKASEEAWAFFERFDRNGLR